MTKPFDNKAECARKEAGPKLRQQLATPRHETPKQEVTNMPFEHDYNDSTQSDNQENSDNWKSIGELARKLAEKQGSDQ